MLFLFVSVLAVLVLLACWFTGEQSPITKAIFTLLYLACFIPMLINKDYDWIGILGQCIFLVIVGGSTFGVEWLGRR
jgi:hypothetical protein